MSNWDIVGFAPQGWQCPICGAVYSPMTMTCVNCTGWKVSNMDNSTHKQLENIVDEALENAIKDDEA